MLIRFGDDYTLLQSAKKHTSHVYFAPLEKFEQGDSITIPEH